jgi:hypothetical protein
MPPLHHEEIASPFIPEFVLPVQLSNSLLWKSPACDLAWAVFADAIAILQRGLRNPRQRGLRLYRETREWVLSDDEEQLYSFLRLCLLFQLDVDAVRAHLLPHAHQTAVMEREARRVRGRPRVVHHSL